MTTPLLQQPVSTLMTTAVVTVTTDETMCDVIVKALKTGVRALPIVNGELHVTGIITEHDLQRSALKTTYHQLQLLNPDERAVVLTKAATIPVALAQSSPAITLPAAATINDALRLLRTMAIKRLPIIGRKQELVGMLTRSDILRNLLYTDPSLLQGHYDPERPAHVGDLELEPALITRTATPLLELLEEMQRALQLHAIVVDGQGAAIGMISESDLLNRSTAPQRAAITALLYGANGEGSEGGESGEGSATGKDDAYITTLTVADLMTTPLISVHPEEETHDAIHLLIEHQIKRFPVLDGNGQVLGLLDRRTLLYGLLDQTDPVGLQRDKPARG